MKIAFIVSEFPGLSITFIINQITALIDRGHTVDIYAARPGTARKVHPAVHRYDLLARTTYAPPQPPTYAARLRRSIRPLIAHPFTNPMARIRILNVLKRGGLASSLRLLHDVVPFLPEQAYDIIHCHYGYSALRIMPAVELGVLKGRILTTFHGADVNAYPRIHGNDVYRELFQRCSMFTANSSFTAGRAVRLGCPPDRIVKLPVGVNLDAFTYRERTPPAHGDDLRILTVANLVEVKGIEYGIRAMARIASAQPRVRYQIAGDGPLLDALKDLAGELGVEDRVELLGGRTHDEVRRLCDRAHLFMLPGVVADDGAEEAQGLVLAEAQASGLPVLATRVGGVPESVLDGQSGFLVQQRDPNALAERLSYLIEHPDRWPEMGKAGRAFVEQNFDAHRLNERLIELYNRLLDKT